MVGDVERDAFGLARDAGVARRAKEPVGRAGWPRSSRPARARARRSRGGECSCRASTSTVGASLRNAAAHSVHRPASTRHAPAWFACRHEMDRRSAGAVRRAGRVSRGRRLHARKPARGGLRKGGIVHSDALSRQASAPPRSGPPTPAGAAASRAAPGRWNTCVRATDADACRPHLDACDRACQRSCRDPRPGRCSASSTIDW